MEQVPELLTALEVRFASAAGGIVASRLLCLQAMPYEQGALALTRS